MSQDSFTQSDCVSTVESLYTGYTRDIKLGLLGLVLEVLFCSNPYFHSIVVVVESCCSSDSRFDCIRSRSCLLYLCCYYCFDVYYCLAQGQAAP